MTPVRTRCRWRTDRLVLVRKTLRGHYWSENLGLDQLIVLLEVRDQRRLVEESCRALALPTCQQSGMLGGPRDQTADVLELS
jgi:hypothetical protein